MTTDRPHDQLAASLVRGQLLYPEDPGYDRALSTWNLQATKRPEAVVSARGPGDIIATIKSVFRVSCFFSIPTLERH